ncbi:MAG: hypothetical protein CSA62_02915 [Planctomycetota bacterium]|nr:MAG: hypothetical protein CSA62_02915 [Planctomycetota bacterium]
MRSTSTGNVLDPGAEIRGAGNRVPFWCWLLVCPGLFAFYLLYAQRSFYLHDGLQIVYTHLHTGNLSHPRHPLYLPLAAEFVKALEFTGASIHTRAVWFSGACTCIAALFFALLGREFAWRRGSYLGLALIFGTCPAVLFFATVVEFHALFLLCAAIAFWWAERCYRRAEARSLPHRLLAAAALGLITWSSAMAHSTGNLILAPIAVTWLVRKSLRACLPELVAMTAIHLALLLLATPLLHAALGRAESPGQPGEWLREWFHPDGAFSRFATVWFRELLLPLAPASLAILVLRRADWPRALWVILGLLPYALLCTFILVDDSGTPIHERGAYFLPWLIPGLILLLQRIRESRSSLARALFVGAIFAIFVVGQYEVLKHDNRPGRDFGTALRTITKEKPSWLLCARRFDLESVLLENAEVRPLLASSLITKSSEQLLAELPGFGDAIAQQLTSGMRVLASESLFVDVPGTPTEVQAKLRIIRLFLKTRFKLRPVGKEPYRFRELLHP